MYIFRFINPFETAIFDFCEKWAGPYWLTLGLIWAKQIDSNGVLS